MAGGRDSVCLVLAVPPYWTDRNSSRLGGRGNYLQIWKPVLTTRPFLGRLPCFLLPGEALALPTERGKHPAGHRVATCALLSLSVGQERFGWSQGHPFIGAVIRDITVVLLLCTLGC